MNELNFDGFKAVIQECFENSRDHGFHDDETQQCGHCGKPNKVPEHFIAGLKLALIHSEASEALEDMRDGDPGRPMYQHRVTANAPPFLSNTFEIEGHLGKPVGYLSELADVVVRVFDEVGRKGTVDQFVQVLQHKLRYNRTRPLKHGRSC